MSNHAVCTVDIKLSMGETLNINRCPVVTAKFFWNRFHEHSCHYLTCTGTFNVPAHPILIIEATN
eukprot:scaffold90389_cov35-Attheya_sp.AAC.1